MELRELNVEGRVLFVNVMFQLFDVVMCWQRAPDDVVSSSKLWSFLDCGHEIVQGRVCSVAVALTKATQQ